MWYREKKNLKSLKEPTLDDEDEEMASEQDDVNYSGEEKEAISDESDDPEADYKAFKLYKPSSETKTTKPLLKQPAKNSKSKPREVTNKSTVSTSNLLKSEYFNRNDQDETSQDQPPMKSKKTMSKSKNSSGKLFENDVHDVLTKMEEKKPKNTSKSTKPRAKKQVRIIMIMIKLVNQI